MDGEEQARERRRISWLAHLDTSAPAWNRRWRIRRELRQFAADLRRERERRETFAARWLVFLREGPDPRIEEWGE